MADLFIFSFKGCAITLERTIVILIDQKVLKVRKKTTHKLQSLPVIADCQCNLQSVSTAVF